MGNYQAELKQRCERVTAAAGSVADSLGSLLNNLGDLLSGATTTQTNSERWTAFANSRRAMAQNTAAAFAQQIYCIKSLDIQPTSNPGGGDGDGAMVTLPAFGVMALALFALFAHLF